MAPEDRIDVEPVETEPQRRYVDGKAGPPYGTELPSRDNREVMKLETR